MNEMYEAVIEWLRIHTIQILCVHIGCVLCVLFVFWYAVNANSTNSVWILNAQFEGGRVRKTKNNWNVYIFLYSIQFEITGCVHWAMHNATCVHHKQRYHIYWYLCWCVNATSNKKKGWKLEDPSLPLIWHHSNMIWLFVFFAHRMFAFVCHTIHKYFFGN